MLNYAIRARDAELINKIGQLQKIAGQEGTELEKQYAGLFFEAREKVKQGIIADARNDAGVAQAQVAEINRNLEMALFEAETPEDEVRINEEYAQELEELGTPESIRRAAEIRSMPNYSPYTILEIKERIADGEVFSNRDLGTLVANGEITATDAKEVGWDPSAAESSTAIAVQRAEEFEGEVEAQAEGAAMAAIQESGQTMSADEKRLVMETQGKAAISKMTRILQQRLQQYLLNNPEATDNEISDWLVAEGKVLAEKMIFQVGDADGGVDEDGNEIPTVNTLTFNDSRGDIFGVEPTMHMPGSNNPGNIARDFTNYDASELAGRSDIAITGDVILSERQIRAATAYIESGQPLPEEYEEIAAALGTNVDTLLRAQFGVHGREFPKVQRGVGEYVTSPQAQTPGTLNRQATQFDTNETIGEVSVDVLRDSVINKESSGNFSAVNPDSGALGYAQVMPYNVGPWSRMVLGYEISTREFLANPELQMRIINGVMSKYMREEAAKGYTGEMLIRRVASRWYSGQADWYDSTTPQNGYPSIRAYTLDVVSRYNSAYS